MTAEMTTKMKVPVEIEPTGALWRLAKTLGVEWALDEDRKFTVENWGDDGPDGKDGLVVLCKGKFETDELFDDRGALFVALRTIAANIVPNVLFRSDPYIQRDYDG